MEAIPTYSIVDWDESFESSESKKVKKAAWVRSSNKHDGLGYRTIAAHAKRCELYAGWKLIVEVASKMPTRGTLHNGKCPLTAHHLSMMTGFPAAVFELCFEVLTEATIGWLAVSESSEAKSQSGQSASTSGESPGTPGCHPDEPGDRPGLPALRRGEENRGEERRIEEKGGASPPGGSRKRETRESVNEALKYPKALDTQYFRVFFEAWVEHRMGLKKPGTTWVVFFQRQLDDKCRPLGENQAARMVRESTLQGYTGLFEPKTGGRRGNQPPSQQETDQTKF